MKSSLNDARREHEPKVERKKRAGSTSCKGDKWMNDCTSNAETVTNLVIMFAEKYQCKGEMVSSAKLALGDAYELRRKGKLELAAKRALKSLAYSVGILHPTYKDCVAQVERLGK